MNAVTTTQSYLRPGFRTGPLQFAGARVWRLLCSHRPIEISRRTAGSDVRAACQSAAGAPTGVGTAGRTHTTCATPVARKRITRVSALGAAPLPRVPQFFRVRPGFGSRGVQGRGGCLGFVQGALASLDPYYFSDYILAVPCLGSPLGSFCCCPCTLVKALTC